MWVGHIQCLFSSLDLVLHCRCKGGRGGKVGILTPILSKANISQFNFQLSFIQDMFVVPCQTNVILIPHEIPDMLYISVLYVDVCLQKWKGQWA